MVNFIYLHNLILGPFHYSELYFEYYFGKCLDHFHMEPIFLVWTQCKSTNCVCSDPEQITIMDFLKLIA